MSNIQQTETITEFHAANYEGIESHCISIAFYRPTLSRAGNNTANVIVNNIPIEAAATFRIGQNVGDIDTTKYDLNFLPAEGEDNELYIIRIVPKK